MKGIDIPTEQRKRQQSAELAMAQGRWSIRGWEGCWKVRTQTDTYTLMSMPDDRLACSCPDYERYGPLGVDCKHIVGLQLWLTSRDASSPANQPSIEKGDKSMNTDNLFRECGWVKLFHPSSVQVTIPLPLERSILAAEAQALMASVTSLLQAGFSVEPPGLEDGEHVEEIGFVVRRSKANADESETPVVDLYPARGNFRLLGKYLNNEADVQAFEAACGVKLSELLLYEGDNSIERGKNPKLDKYVVALRVPVKVVWKLNPRYEGESDKRNSKRLFVRWASLPVLQAAKAMSLDEARACLCPMGTKTHPEYKGQTLEQIAQAEDGRKVLEYLAGEQYQPNGDEHGQKAKAAAKVLLASLQPA